MASRRKARKLGALAYVHGAGMVATLSYEEILALQPGDTIPAYNSYPVPHGRERTERDGEWKQVRVLTVDKVAEGQNIHVSGTCQISEGWTQGYAFDARALPA